MAESLTEVADENGVIHKMEIMVIGLIDGSIMPNARTDEAGYTVNTNWIEDYEYVDLSKEHNAIITLNVEDGYTFSDDVEVTINYFPAQITTKSAEEIKIEYHVDPYVEEEKLLHKLDIYLDDLVVGKPLPEPYTTDNRYVVSHSGWAEEDEVVLKGKDYGTYINLEPNMGENYLFATGLEVKVNGKDAWIIAFGPDQLKVGFEVKADEVLDNSNTNTEISNKTKTIVGSIIAIITLILTWLLSKFKKK